MNKKIQSNLLNWAVGFLFLQSLLITLAPVVRNRTWDTVIPWTHWIAFILWSALILYVRRNLETHLPESDPYLFPVAALLSGWGMLTIWRLENNFGERQALWIGASMMLLAYGTRISSLQFLRRYKYVLLAGGLFLTTLTLFLGTNPSGYGPKLWLGFYEVYFQPSETLKLLLIAYLAAFLADKLPYKLRTIHLLYPTLILSGIVILLLLAQRDLGTASIFIALYTIMIYLATEQRKILIISVVLLAVVSLAGYHFIDIVRTRIDSWLNPWSDPGGSSYQIIQSLIAIANGGVEGRGPGLGYPRLIPVAQSDFIYSAIAEETGLVGSLGLLALFAIILSRGFRIALRAPDLFRRFLAAGLTTYFGVQTILIVGGNLRLLPLTGVTLPFVSYGGSSLLTSFIALLILLLISNSQEEEPAPLSNPSPYILLSTILSLGIFASALTNGWWSVVRGPDLLTRPDNQRLMIDERYVPRGALLDRFNTPIDKNIGNIGTYTRSYEYPDLAPVTGYTDPIYGQAGLELTLDAYLRGESGTPALSVWWNHLLYGTSPHGLDMRLSIELSLQTRVDELMLGRAGAAVVLNAQNGEILVLSSHPTFDPNHLKEISSALITDPKKPLVNRPAYGLYPTDSIMLPFIAALYKDTPVTSDQLQIVYERFNFFVPPQLRMDVAPPFQGNESKNIHVTPLQMALASAALSNHGTIPAPRIASAVNTPQSGWVVLPALGKPTNAIPPLAADDTANSYGILGENYWSYTSRARDEKTSVAWFIGGTLPNWQATPLVVVVLLEGESENLAHQIGSRVFLEALNP